MSTNGLPHILRKGLRNECWNKPSCNHKPGFIEKWLFPIWSAAPFNHWKALIISSFHGIKSMQPHFGAILTVKFPLYTPWYHGMSSQYVEWTCGMVYTWCQYRCTRARMFNAYFVVQKGLHSHGRTESSKPVAWHRLEWQPGVYQKLTPKHKQKSVNV